ncbi:MAG: M1 family aminopeptidase [Bacillota bacterium]|nr:M1 family aminopeptidase [Bacillota bacterium]
MKLFSLFRVELRRMFHSKICLSVAALSLFTPLFGYSLYIPSSNVVMSGKYLANPVLAGTAIGAVLFAVLAIIEADRTYRARINALIDSISSPVKMAMARILALIGFLTLTGLVCTIIYLPYTIIKLDYIFDFATYLASFFIIMIPTWWISTILAAALYQITRRIELSGLLYAGCVYLCYSPYFQKSYFTRWINPLIVTYSDGFSNAYTFRITLYTRILWLAIAGGVFVFSLTCIRRYQRNLIGSFWRGIRKVYIPIAAAVLVVAGALLWRGQPFVDHGPLEFDYNHMNATRLSSSSNSICYNVSFRITAKPISGTVHGIAQYTISSSNGISEDSFWLNPGYRILGLTYGSKKLDFRTLDNDVNGERQTVFTLPKAENQILTVEYEGFPALLRCFSPTGWGVEVSTEYVSLNNAYSVPCNTSFGLPGSSWLEITLPSKLTPIVEHKFVDKHTDNKDGTRTWKTEVQCSQYIWITACDYSVIPFTVAGINVDLVYSSKYDKNMRSYDIPNAIKSVFDYCTSHQGKIRFSDNRRMMLLQRNGSGGGNASDGWVEWDEPIFTSVNLSNPLKGANAAEVFAHEIIHEWWGGLGVECHGGDECWSSEGLTVYTTYRLMKEKYGELYSKQNYVDVWQSKVDAQNRGFYYRHPEYLEKLPERYQADLKIANTDTNLYCRMPLMILKAEKLVGGEEKMDKILRTIQENNSGNGYAKPFTYQDFLDACGLTKEELELE